MPVETNVQDGLKGGACVFSLAAGTVELSPFLADHLGYGPYSQSVSMATLFAETALPAFMSCLSQVTRASSVVHARATVRHADKGLQVLNWMLAPGGTCDQAIGIASAMSVIEMPEIAELLNSVFENLSDGFALYDKSDRLIFCNQVYRSVFHGHDVPDLVGTRFDDIAHLCYDIGLYGPPGAATNDYLMDRIEKHHSGHGVIFQTLPNGRVERIVERRLPSGFTFGLHSDVSDIFRAKNEAHRESEAKSEFLSTMSHEIRTPLVGLIGLLDLFDPSQSEEERNRILALVRDSGETLLGIVNAILDMSKIEAGRMELESRSFDPLEVMRPIVARHREIARRKGVVVSCNLGDAKSCLRLGDPLRFGQIVENILSNAIKFTDKGSISIHLQNRASGQLSVTIADTGIGMSPSVLARVVRPFEQADGSISRKYGGTGLGLSIASRLTALFEGKLTCSSNQGEGTSFTIKLPLPAVNRKKGKGDPGQSGRRFDGVKALIADDNPINRLVLTEFLTRIGISVDAVEDGQKAVAAVATGSYDVVLTDLSMPEMDGYAVLKAIRNLRGMEDLPVIAVSANAMAQDIENSQKFGFAAHLAKPFRLADLVEMLHHTLATPQD